MARRPRSAHLETRTARLKLPVRKRPHRFVTIAPGIALGYRRNQGAGTWVVRVADGHGSSWTKGFAIADDYEDADHEHVLDFWQAQDKARALARGTDEGGRPATVAQAIDAYEADLCARGGLSGNVSRLRHHVPTPLAAKVVALLTARELKRWRDALAIKPASINRTAHVFKAVLNHAAEHDERITNTRAWKIGLALLPNAHRARNVILGDEQVRDLIAAAYAENPAFGLLTEVAAVTGARPCQLVQLEVGDLQIDRADGPRLLMPSSRKGGAGKKIERRPVPIPAGLAVQLRQAACEREAGEPLLRRPDGVAWSATSADHRRPFMNAVGRAGLDPKVTFYALRHSSIVRSLLAGVPVRIVAVAHDTSTAMIERTYSRHISDHADAVLRRGLLDVAQPEAANVVPLPGRRS